MHTLPDPAGDGALDIMGTSWVEVGLSKQDTRRLQRDEHVLVAATRDKVLKAGRCVPIGLDLAGDPAVGDTVTIATDASDGRLML